MHLELSEVLACPACGPPQVMVAVVSEGRGSRVVRGFLGCPACEARFSIEQGTVYLGEGGAGGEVETIGPPPLPDESAMLLGAVLDLGRGSGRILLAPELGDVAGDLTGLTEGWEVVSLLRAGPGLPEPRDRLTHVVLPDSGELPVLPARFRAVALAGSRDSADLARYAKALAPLGRIAILAPDTQTSGALREAGLEVVAADSRVAVAARRA